MFKLNISRSVQHFFHKHHQRFKVRSALIYPPSTSTSSSSSSVDSVYRKYLARQQLARGFKTFDMSNQPQHLESDERQEMDVVSTLYDTTQLKNLFEGKVGNTALGIVSESEWIANRKAFWAQQKQTKGVSTEFSPFDCSLYMQKLSAQVYGRTLLYAFSMPSTQTFMQSLGKSFPESTVCVTDVQSAGKGRGGNQWDSPLGCLMFTFNCRLGKTEAVPMVQYLACLAIVQGVNSIPEFQSLDVKIKWPNDIYINRDTKIGGILCQSIFVENQFLISIGIGLNVDNTYPTTCLNQVAKSTVGREIVLANILSKFEHLYNEFVKNGFTSSIKQQYESSWLHSGQTVTLEEEGCEVKIKGISVAGGGCLLAVDEKTGAEYELYPDGNRLDFFKGLISKKVN